MKFETLGRAQNLQRFWTPHPHNIDQLSYWRVIQSADGSRFITDNGNGMLCVFSLPELQTMAILQQPLVHDPKWMPYGPYDRKQFRYALTPDASRAVCLCDRGHTSDWDLHLWDVDAARLIKTIRLEGTVNGVACGPSTAVVLIDAHHLRSNPRTPFDYACVPEIQIRRLSDLECTRVIPVGASPRSFALSLTGAVGACEDISEITLWNLGDGERLCKFDAVRQVDRVYFAPDAEQIFLQCVDNVQLYDCSDGKIFDPKRMWRVASSNASNQIAYFISSRAITRAVITPWKGSEIAILDRSSGQTLDRLNLTDRCLETVWRTKGGNLLCLTRYGRIKDGYMLPEIFHLEAITGIPSSAKLIGTENDVSNVVRWRHSGAAERWVVERHGSWNHEDWLNLLSLLRESEYWPMSEALIGMVIEHLRERLVRHD